MDAACMREILKREYGICGEAEFDNAVAKFQGIDIGIFTMPFDERRERHGQKEKEAATA